MRTIRFFYPLPLASDTTCVLDGGIAHHLAQVLRAKVGDTLQLFNADNGEFTASITNVSRREIEVKIGACIRTPEPLVGKVTLCFSPLKRDALHTLLEKATELGVTHLQPVRTQYTQSHAAVDEGKAQQWLIDAAQQSERLSVPTILPEISLADFMKTPADNTLTLVALERAEGIPTLFQALQKQKQENITVLIGAEGGFAPIERERILKTQHITPVSLGHNILRAETAALAMLSIVMALR